MQAEHLIEKVVGQVTWLAHWDQKVGGQLPVLPNRFRRQWLLVNVDVHTRVSCMQIRLHSTAHLGLRTLLEIIWRLRLHE